MSDRVNENEERFYRFVEKYNATHTKPNTAPVFSEKAKEILSRDQLPKQPPSIPQTTIEEKRVETVSEETKQKKENKCRWIFLIPLVLIGLLWVGFGVYQFFSDAMGIFDGGVGILNFLSIPFSILGGINLLRGYGAVLESDAARFGFSKDWHAAIHLFVSIAGHIALIYVFKSL
jgi:hypothetical protein